eukprot:4231689-Prymnesium_polylepis.1
MHESGRLEPVRVLVAHVVPSLKPSKSSFQLARVPLCVCVSSLRIPEARPFLFICTVAARRHKSQLPFHMK